MNILKRLKALGDATSDRLFTKAMIDGELQPGDKIPTELELAESMGVGRLSIREAIKVLVYYGVLEIRRPEGTFVCEGFSDIMLDPMLYGIILSKDKSLENLKELRLLIEVGVIKLAMDKYTEDDKIELMSAIEKFRIAVSKDKIDWMEIFEVDDLFHATVSKMGKNPLVSKINQLVRTLTRELRLQTVNNMVSIDEARTLYEAHVELARKIIARDRNNIYELVEHGYFYDKVDITRGNKDKKSKSVDE